MKKRRQDFKPLLKELIMFMLGGAVGVLLLGVSWEWIVRGAIFPRVMVAGVEVGGMQRAKALSLIKEKMDRFELKVRYGATVWEVPKTIFGFEPEKSIERAMTIGKKWDLKVFRQMLTGKIALPMEGETKIDEWQEWVSGIESSVLILFQPARFEYRSGKLSFVNGEDGIEPDFEILKTELVEAGRRLEPGERTLPIKEIRMRLTPEEARRAQQVAETLVGSTAKLVIEDVIITLNTPELLSFIDLSPLGIGLVKRENVKNYVEGLAERYNRVPQNARFVFAEGRVKEFSPSKEGIRLEIEKTTDSLQHEIEKLLNGEKNGQVEIILDKTPPKISTGEVNSLGIVKLIGRGESYYAHSIANRIYNIGLAASRINGELVAPGEEFSFNQTVGEVSGKTGYRTAYVIANGRTELGDGGGVCQVSTTLFRAVMAAGLPISERWAHAYRVGYYEQNSEPGFDATVYSPSKDFKFINDTPGYILIQTINDPVNKHLVFELYGTSDGRIATTSKVKVSGVTPPPPDLFQDDPSLPTGVVKQVDWAAWGAKAVFEYKVERGGKIIYSKTYTSNYRPWQNVYLRGTGQ